MTRAGVDIRLTAKEYMLLEYLMRNAGRVVTKTMIAEHVWDFDLEAETNFIEVYIYTLRKKIDAPFDGHLSAYPSRLVAGRSQIRSLAYWDRL